jgi:hypothetical protein
MIAAVSAGFGTAWGPAVLAACLAVAAIAGLLSWRRGRIREPRVRAAVVALRVVLLVLLGLAIADPTISRDVRSRPRLAVVWDDGAVLDVADAPGGVPRRDALARAVAGADLGDHFELAAPDPESPVDATLFVTDGQAAAKRFASLDGRVAALVPARDPAVPDLSIVEVAAPPTAVPGAWVSVDVTLRSRGARGLRAVVTLSDESRVLSSAASAAASDDELTTVTLSGALQGPGWQRLVVEAAPVTGEAETSDNRFEVWVDVEERRREVLFLESQPTWEGKFVRRALEDDPSFHVDYVARVSKAAELAQPSAEVPEGAPVPAPKVSTIRAALADAARLDRYDAVVLGPLDASELGAADVERLASFVSSRGGGLVVLGGNAYAGSILSSRGLLADLLPAAVPASSFGPKERASAEPKTTVRLRPATGAERTPAFAALGTEPERALEQLRPLGDDYLRLGALKPGATALAIDGAARSDPKPVLLAAQPFGAGRVTLVAPSDTWRLAVGAPDELASAAARIWTGLVAWSAAGAEDPITVRVASARVAAGEPVRAELVVRTPTFEPVAATSVAARCERTGVPDEAPFGVAFAAAPAAPGVYVASVAPPAPGTWTITAESGGRSVAATVEAVAPDADRSRPDPVRSARFADAVRARGGSVVSSDRASEVVDALGAPEPGRRSVISHPARSPWWGLAALLVFCAEIFVRRRFGVD